MGSKDQNLLDCEVSALVRRDEKARILEKKGIRPVFFDDLDATEQLRNIATHFDGRKSYEPCICNYCNINAYSQ